MTNTFERLQKVIAKSGITSRRKAEKLIEDGRVKVNGKTVTQLGTKVSQTDEVEVDDIPLEKEAPVYYMLYKPQGVISSVEDDKSRLVVVAYSADIQKHLHPIVRLHYHASGLLFLTNDGEFANLLLHPSHGVNKVYIAKIKGIPTKKELNKFKKGIASQNDLLKANDATLLSADRKNNTSIIQVTLQEGKNRQVRR